MARPRCCRRIANMPHCVLFKPAGIPASCLEDIVLSLDELEALRLADLAGLYHEQAAERMMVSRPTFGRTLESARRKVTQVLIEGKALRIEGGEVEMSRVRTFTCRECQREWEVPFGAARPAECPSCKNTNIHRSETERGMGGPRGQGRNRNGCRRGQSR